MDEEMNYLSEKIQDLENNVQRDIDYGYSGERVDDQLNEIRLLSNVLSALTISELNN